jgi:membrane associated rhomboid family serine protease
MFTAVTKAKRMRPSPYHEYRPTWRPNVSGSMVNRIILLNVVIHVAKAFASSPMSIVYLFGLSPALVVTKFYIWQPITYMFLHADFMHIFFNMLMTWFLGTTLEAVWGPRKFLTYYLVCGLGGAAFSAVFTFNGPPVIGASAAVFGLYLAYAMIFPNNYVYLYFLFPVRAKYLVTFIAAIQLVSGIAGSAGIAYFAHLGGMAAGLLFFRREIRATRLWTRAMRWLGGRTTEKRRAWYEQEQAKIDSILDKIQSKGFENLSATEKRILENYSRKQKEDSE